MNSKVQAGGSGSGSAGGARGGGGQGQLRAAAAVIAKKRQVMVETNPLLVDQVLLNLFSYFEHDTKNLGSFRRVCVNWKSAADKEYKKAKPVWKVGGASQKEYAENEAAFVDLVSKSNSDIFTDFDLDGRHSPTKFKLRNYRVISSFQTDVCPLIVRLDLQASDNVYLNQYLKHMVSLEQLSLTIPKVGTGSSVRVPVPFQVPRLAKLTKFRIVVEREPTITIKRIHLDRLTALCSGVLDNSPLLQQITFEEAQSCKISYVVNSLRACQNPSSFSNVTCLNLLLHLTPPSLLTAIMQKCPRLTRFSAVVAPDRHGAAIQEFLDHFAPQLEELTFGANWRAYPGPEQRLQWPCDPSLKFDLLRPYVFPNVQKLEATVRNLDSLRLLLANMHALNKLTLIHSSGPASHWVDGSIGDIPPELLEILPITVLPECDAECDDCQARTFRNSIAIRNNYSANIED